MTLVAPNVVVADTTLDKIHTQLTNKTMNGDQDNSNEVMELEETT